MKSNSAVLMVVALMFGAAAMSYADQYLDLSNEITKSPRTWTGRPAAMNNGQFEALPFRVENCQVRFSSGWRTGFLRVREMVEFEVESTSAEGQWRRITRTMRCGNPARGRYFVPAPKPVVVTRVVECPAPYLVQSDPTVCLETIERVVRVPEYIETQRTVVVPEVVYLTPPPVLPPPGIRPMHAPSLSAIPTGYRVAGPWRALATATVVAVPERECRKECEPPKDPTCGPGEPPVQPGPGDAAGPGNGGIDPGLGQPGGYTPPPAVPPGYGDGGNAAPPTAGPPTPPVGGTGPAIPDPGTSPVTPATTPWGGNAAPAP